MVLTINGSNYASIDALERISSKDSFTHPQNKIGSASGAWEWHIGSKNDNSRYAFFGGIGFSVRGVVFKSDLLWMMKQLEEEYQVPSQQYRGASNFPALYQQRMNAISALEEVSYFTFSEHDNRNIRDQRLYAKRPGTTGEGDHVYGLLRQVMLPNVTYTSILKLIAPDGDTLYYFKIFPENFDSVNSEASTSRLVEEIVKSQDIPQTEKVQLVKSRIGQGVFRSQVLQDCRKCVFTGVDDSRLLIASHIKPWSISSNQERLDVKNGLVLTPTYDRLFDGGLVSFDENKCLLVSSWVSESTRSLLGIVPGVEIASLPTNGRQEYLAFHRTAVFKG
jgi:hypothetical protein